MSKELGVGRQQHYFSVVEQFPATAVLHTRLSRIKLVDTTELSPEVKHLAAVYTLPIFRY